MSIVANIFLGLGSNLGDRQSLLNFARHDLKNLPIDGFIASPIYESEPYQRMEQSKYYNQVVGGHTSLSPTDLLKACHSIEEKLGRIRKERWGPRLIDIDILYYGDLVLNTEYLIIPHVDICNRGPVLLPLNDLVPSWEDPRFRKSVKALLKSWQHQNSEPLPIRVNLPYL